MTGSLVPCISTSRQYASLHVRAMLLVSPLPAIDEDTSLKIGDDNSNDSTSSVSTERSACLTDVSDEHGRDDGRDDTGREGPELYPTEPFLVILSVPGKSCLKSKTSKSTTRETKQSVQFGTITIRRYETTIGDNPGCTHGVPITLDWGYVQQPSVFLDDYLDMKGDNAKPRRPHAFHLNSHKRYTMLAQAGFDTEELRRVKHEVKRVKRGRKVSYWMYPAAVVRQTLKAAFA